MSYHEAVGCIHIHSLFSDGTGSIPDLIEAAEQANLDFLLLTDHDTVKARKRGLEGWYGRTLIVVGHEAGKDRGHLLAVNTPQRIRSNSGDAADIVKKSKQSGGLTFVAHPDGHPKPAFGIRDSTWKARMDHGFEGLEVWSYMYDWITDVQWWNLPARIARPNQVIQGPKPETLALWDRLGAQRPVTGFGGVDAHAREVFPGIKIFPYPDMFTTIHNHLILKEPLSGNSSRDKKLILEALAAGRCYIAMENPGSATGFRFEAVLDNRTLQMGDSAEISDKMVNFKGTCPQSANLILRRDGQACFEGEARSWQFETEQSGVYRVEVWRKGRPWIFSNPIYLRTNRI